MWQEALAEKSASSGVRLIVVLLLVPGGLLLHELVQVQPDSVWIVDGAVEQSMPFLPWTIWIYLLFFPFVAWAVFRTDQARFWRLVSSAILAALIAWSVVLILPISFERPDPESIAGDGLRAVYRLIHAADPAHVTFPSLHVAVTWICNYHTWRLPARGLRLALAIAITLSTLLTRQHLLWDVAGGLALAWFCIWLTRCRES